MSFFTQASFVMDPNVYGVGKLYVPKPTDGSGDLTFTRASNGTRVNQDGLIEKVRTNLLPYSQDFSNWSTNSCTVSTNTTANPLNGAVDADTITFTGATTQKYVIQAFSFNGNYTVSVYLKAGTNQFVQFLIGSDASPYVNFDLVNGISNAFGSTANIVSVGNGWYRCSMSFTSTIGTHVFLNAVNSLSAYRFDATSSTGTLIAFGYQLETGDIATDYIPTTTSAVTVGPVANLPRLNYGADGCPSLLLEPQRTNLVTYSEQLDNAAWTKTSCTISANAAISPSGYQDADNIVTTAANSDVGRLVGSVSADSSTYTQSAFIKWVSGTENVLFRIALAGGTAIAGVLVFNARTGAFVSSDTSYKIENYGNGWYRVSIQLTNNGTNTNLIYQLYPTNATTATQTLSAWGLSTEVGAYATSYIPTLSSAVTRVADAASKTGISSLIGQTEGTIFLEIDEKSVADNRLVAISDTLSSASNYFIIQREGTNALQIRYLSGGSESVLATVSGFSQGKHKIAFAYKNSEFNVCVDGTSNLVTSTITMPTSLSTIQFSKHPLYSSVYYNAAINQALLFKTRLSNADLARLTSL